MASILDVLQSLFPDKSDAELTSYSQDPAVHDALKDLLPTPDSQTEDQSTPPKTGTEDNETVNPSVADFKLPPANSSQSSFDVNESTSPVAMKGAMPSAPTGNIQQPNPSIPAPTPETATLPSATPPVAPSADVPKSTTPTTPTAPTQQVAEAPLAQNLSDNDERQKMLAQEATKRKEGIIPILLGGAGDAISTGATAFGANAGTPVLDKIVDMESKNITQDKTQFEDNLRNDPSSDVSRSYQKVLGMMMGKPQTDPDIIKMSANTIASQLPEVEKFMTKEISLKQIQATKQLAMSQQQGNERDRMWNQAVQSINSVRGDKPLVDSETMRNGAISAYKAIQHIQNQGREPNQIEYYDLLGQLWKARNGSSVTGEEIQKMDPATYQSKIGPIATFLSNKTVSPITTPGVTNALKDFVVQSGKTADQIHDSYMNSRGVNSAASRMQQFFPDDAARLAKMARGQSFAEATGVNYNNPAQTNQSSNANDSAALDWAKTNPNDPRAAKIFQILGVK